MFVLKVGKGCVINPGRVRYVKDILLTMFMFGLAKCVINYVRVISSKGCVITPSRVR